MIDGSRSQEAFWVSPMAFSRHQDCIVVESLPYQNLLALWRI